MGWGGIRVRKAHWKKMPLSSEPKKVKKSSGFIHSFKRFVEHLLYDSIVLGLRDLAGDK